MLCYAITENLIQASIFQRTFYLVYFLHRYFVRASKCKNSLHWLTKHLPIEKMCSLVLSKSFSRRSNMLWNTVNIVICVL